MAKPLYTIAARILGCIATLTALIVMLTSDDKAKYPGSYDYTFETGYSHYEEFQYFVIANGIGSCYNLLVLFLPSGSMLWPLVVVLDLVISFLLLASGASSSTSFSKLRNGVPHLGWEPVCYSVPHFCGHVLGALIPSWIGFVISAGLLLSSIHMMANPLLLPNAC